MARVKKEVIELTDYTPKTKLLLYIVSCILSRCFVLSLLLVVANPLLYICVAAAAAAAVVAAVVCFYQYLFFVGLVSCVWLPTLTHALIVASSFTCPC